MSDDVDPGAIETSFDGAHYRDWREAVDAAVYLFVAQLPIGPDQFLALEAFRHQIAGLQGMAIGVAKLDGIPIAEYAQAVGKSRQYMSKLLANYENDHSSGPKPDQEAEWYWGELLFAASRIINQGNLDTDRLWISMYADLITTPRRSFQRLVSAVGMRLTSMRSAKQRDNLAEEWSTAQENISRYALPDRWTQTQQMTVTLRYHQLRAESRRPAG